jgi:hypothetical protein
VEYVSNLKRYSNVMADLHGSEVEFGLMGKVSAGGSPPSALPGGCATWVENSWERPLTPILSVEIAADQMGCAIDTF